MAEEQHSGAVRSDDDQRNEYIPAVDVHVFRSKYVAQTFKVQVMLPACRKGEQTAFPVVYVTDGNFAFDVLRGISCGMQRSQHDAPRFILVGIGYPHESPFAGAVLRARDFTFPLYPKLRVEPPAMEGVLVPEEGTKSFGGAEDFQEFIAQELIGRIDSQYPTVPGDRTYFGHSGGGGFGLFTLFTRPELFNNYIVSSPGLIFDGESSAGVHYDDYDFLLRYARGFIRSGKSLPGKRLYMSVGAEEEFEPNLESWRLTSSFYRMAALMKKGTIPGLELTTEVFPGATHMTVWPTAYIRGIQAVFHTGMWGTLSAAATRVGEWRV
jgi:predicted alpha/beta superfamily hydrolase